MLFAINPRRIHYHGESLAYSADGKSLIVAVEKRVKETTETAIGLYDADTGKRLRTIPTQWNFLSDLAPPNAVRLIAAGACCARDADDRAGPAPRFYVHCRDAPQTSPT